MWIERNLFATCTSGLCNRLLLLAGSMRIAAETRRSLAVYWPVNEALGCSFEELFVNRFDMVTEAEFGHILKTNFNVKVYNAWRTDEPDYRAVRRDGDPTAHIVIIKGWSDPRFENETHSNELDAAVRRRLLELRPRPAIEDLVGAYPLPPACIGVHVRRGDNLEGFGASKEVHFFRLMRRVLELRPETTFFLATDVEAVEERFRAEFSQALVSAPKQWAARQTVQGVREGLIDLLLLARTTGIIGNVQSSFSLTAAKLGARTMFVADESNAGDRLEKTCAALISCLPVQSGSPVSIQPGTFGPAAFPLPQPPA